MDSKMVIKKKTFYILAFAIPFTVMTGICIINGVYPFGGNSFMHCDMYHQYVPFLVEFWRKLHGGKSLAYAWNLGLGTDFTAIYGYYLATPTNWLVYFVPEHLIIEFMTLMIVLKIAMCGLTFSFYLSRRFGGGKPVMLAFSTLYALSGFVAAYNWNHMWLDVLWLAPLVMLGLERLVRGKKPHLYCLALTASIFTNYYLSIMLCVFLVLYFAVQLFTNGLTLREKAGAVGRFALYSLLAGAMSAALLIPVLRAMYTTGFSDFDFPKKIEFYFNALEMLARHAVATPKEIGLDHWPNVYCGVFLFVLVPMYAFCGRIPLKQRIAKLLLAAFLLLGFATNVLNFIWHGFNYPNSLPARQSFLYIFLLLTMGYEALSHIREWKLPWFIASLLCGSGLFAACSVFVTTDGFTVTVAALTWFFLAVYVILAVLYMRWEKRRLFLLWLTVALVVGESALNMYETSVGVVTRDYYASKWDNYEALLEETKGEGGFFRYESFFDMTKNDGALAGYPGVSLFSSTTLRGVADYYEDIGLKGTKVSYYSDGLTAFTSALLGVKYTFSGREEDPALYRKAAESNDMYLYENIYTLPVGFMMDDGLAAAFGEIFEEGGANRLKVQNDMAEALGESPLFLYERRAEIVSDKEAPAGDREKEDAEGRDKEEGQEEKRAPDVSVRTDEAAHYYAFLSGDAGEKLTMAAGGETREYEDLKKNSILDLGRQEAGTELVFSPEGEKHVNLWLYRLDEAALAGAVAKLGGEPFLADGYGDGWMKGRVEAAAAGNLVFSIPYGEGWTVTVDGKAVEPDIYAGALLSVPVFAGRHEVELLYRRAGTAAGAFVSAAGAALYLACVWRGRRRERKLRE